MQMLVFFVAILLVGTKAVARVEPKTSFVRRVEIDDASAFLESKPGTERKASDPKVHKEIKKSTQKSVSAGADKSAQAMKYVLQADVAHDSCDQDDLLRAIAKGAGTDAKTLRAELAALVQQPDFETVVKQNTGKEVNDYVQEMQGALRGGQFEMRLASLLTQAHIDVYRVDNDGYRRKGHIHLDGATRTVNIAHRVRGDCYQALAVKDTLPGGEAKDQTAKKRDIMDTMNLGLTAQAEPSVGQGPITDSAPQLKPLSRKEIMDMVNLGTTNGQGSPPTPQIYSAPQTDNQPKPQSRKEIMDMVNF